MTAAMSKPLHTIRASSGMASLELAELWAYRDLLVAFAMRDVRLRYRQTALGAIWVVLQPLLAAAIFSFVFGRIAKFTSGNVPYFVFAFAGMMIWNVFSATVTKSSASLLQNTNLVSKVYFPRLIMPMAPGASTLIDAGISFVLLLILMLINGVVPTIGILLAPVFLAMTLMIGLGVSFIASALSVAYRDVQYVIPVMVNLLMYISPVAYAADVVPAGNSRFLFFLNPLTPIFDAFRWSVLGVGSPQWGFLAYSAVAGLVLFWGGAMIFRNLEKGFADVI
jgi:lipopolysaccharide transport system permease protein